MMYLKSQVNPHFLYNTLDTIRINAQMNGDKDVAEMLMQLVEFFRLSVKVDKAVVTLEHIAFIIVSGYDDFEYCREAIRLKIVDYILKPVNFEEFGEIIDNLKINIYRAEEENNIEKKEDNQLIFNMTGYLKEHIGEDISLKKLADYFHLSPNYTGQIFKDKIGVNYQAYLANLRMEEAKSLLLTTQKSVAEIAELVGYKDYRIFTRTFKRMEKITPTKYRSIT